MNVTLSKNENVEQIKAEALQKIKDYYKEVLTNEWETGEWTVRISQIENRILDIKNVIDVNDTKLVTLTESNTNYHDYSVRIPIINEVTINVD